MQPDDMCVCAVNISEKVLQIFYRLLYKMVARRGKSTVNSGLYQ